MAKLWVWEFAPIRILCAFVLGWGGAFEYSAFAQTTQDYTVKPGAINGGYQQIYQWAPHAYKNQPTTQGPEAPQISVAFDRSVEVRSMMAEFISEKIERLRNAELR